MDAPFFTKAFLDRATELFAQAAKLATGDEKLLHAVERAELPLLYVKLSRGPQFVGETYGQCVDRFEQIARREKLAYLAEGGSDYILTKVLRLILEGEQESVARGDAARSALTLDNYDMLREEPAEGDLLVTRGDADLVRVAGRLAKNPSFWTERVDIIRSYGRIAGVRVPLSVESVAQVRIAGRR